MRLNWIIGLLILLFFIPPDIADAQWGRKRRGPSKLDLRLGLKGGVNYATFGGDNFVVDQNAQGILEYPAVSYDFRLGWYGGVYLDMLVSRSFHFQPEIHYSTIKVLAGHDINLSGLETRAESEFELTYLLLQLNGKIKMGKSSFFVIGPQLSTKLKEERNQSIEVDTLGLAFPSLYAAHVNVYNSVDAGVNVGIDYQTDFGLNVGLRYYHGLMNIHDVDGLPLLAIQPNNNLMNAQMTAGYTIRHESRVRKMKRYKRYRKRRTKRRRR